MISCTGATGAAHHRATCWPPPAPTARARSSVIDLALPRDVEPGVATLPGVTADRPRRPGADPARRSDAGGEVGEVRRIVGRGGRPPSSPPGARPASRRPSSRCDRWRPRSSTPSWSRLDARLPGLDDAAREEIRRTVSRVADKLLHEPTVRVKELANEAGAVSYAAALAELFALDPEAVDAVTRPEGLANDPRVHDPAAPPDPRRHPPLACSPPRSPGRSPTSIRTRLGPRDRAGRDQHRG